MQYPLLIKQGFFPTFLYNGRNGIVVDKRNVATLKDDKDEKQKEIEHLDGEIGSKELILEWRKQAVADTENTLDKLGTELQNKNAVVEQLDSEISEKENIKAKTETALAEKQAILSESAHKVFKINYIDNIETGKTVFGGKVTVSPDDYDRLTDLAKKQIAAESREGALTAQVTKLKKENEELSSENSVLQEQAQTARSLKLSLSALQLFVVRFVKFAGWIVGNVSESDCAALLVVSAARSRDRCCKNRRC